MSSKARRVKRAFDREMLRTICEMHEDEFAEAYGLATVEVMQHCPADRYYYKDNGSDILFVAHLDTVVDHRHRGAHFVKTNAGEVVHSGALDDRLGVYIGLELLPALGITHDWLLTTGEESGLSTADFFDTADHGGKEYNYVIEFDRGGTDVVMYQYEDEETKARVRNSGARVGDGILSDISYMEHLEVKCFNWGVGYHDYHSTRGYAYLSDTFLMVARYLRFHEQNKDTYMPHEYKGRYASWGGKAGSWWGDDPDWYSCSTHTGYADDIVDGEFVDDFNDEAVIPDQRILLDDLDAVAAHAEAHGGTLAAIGECEVCDDHRRQWEEEMDKVD